VSCARSVRGRAGAGRGADGSCRDVGGERERDPFTRIRRPGRGVLHARSWRRVCGVRGYTSERALASCCTALGVATAQHQGPMTRGRRMKRRVGSSRSALRRSGHPACSIGTNNLDTTAIRWLEDVLTSARQRWCHLATTGISSSVLHAHGRRGLGGTGHPGHYDRLHGSLDPGEAALQKDNARPGTHRDLEEFVRRFRAHRPSAPATSRMKRSSKLQSGGREASSRQ